MCWVSLASPSVQRNLVLVVLLAVAASCCALLLAQAEGVGSGMGMAMASPAMGLSAPAFLATWHAGGLGNKDAHGPVGDADNDTRGLGCACRAIVA